MDNSKVRKALLESKRRIEARVALLPRRDERNLKLDAIRKKMFTTRTGDNAFDPLNDEELALLEWKIEKYVRSGRFKILAGGGEEENDFLKHLDTLRHNHLSETHEVSPQEFRKASSAIIDLLLRRVTKDLKLSPKTSTCFMTWRGALAFATPAHQWGCSNFHHLGAARNEKTAEAEVYYRHPFVLRVGHIYLSVDPMLATGGTQITMIEELLSEGVKEENIVVLSIVSAPEGVDRILNRYPRVRIVTVAHDEFLNQKAYIWIGLGDWGDIYFEDFTEQDVVIWHVQGILNDEALAALIARMQVLTAV